jgi:hypothetical protein
MEFEMVRFALLSAVTALTVVAASGAQAQVNITGGYVCEGNCANPGQCARAYVDGWFPGSNHISLYSDAGTAAEGRYAAATLVMAPAWGLAGEIYPDQIIWRPLDSPRVIARWVKTPACWY